MYLLKLIINNLISLAVSVSEIILEMLINIS